jgi:uroporphyrinogen-III synthase
VADFASGTVFYLFSPFTGRILIDVLDRLQMESIERRVRVCSLGPCTRVLADQKWLKATTDSDPGRIAVFESE